MKQINYEPCNECTTNCLTCAFNDLPQYMKDELIKLGWDKDHIGRRDELEVAKRKIMKDLTPPGPYCYVADYSREDDLEIGYPVVYCPHSSSKEFNGVSVPWCDLLNAGGTDNGHTDEEWEKLVEHFGSEENVFDFLPHDLLWDSCKECGINHDAAMTKESIIAWIDKVNQYKK